MSEREHVYQFKKDYTLCIKRGYDMLFLQNIINILIIPEIQAHILIYFKNNIIQFLIH